MRQVTTFVAHLGLLRCGEQERLFVFDLGLVSILSLAMTLVFPLHSSGFGKLVSDPLLCATNCQRSSWAFLNLYSLATWC